ncbi:MAG: flap endonuclease Xni [Parashewanella sp.]
MNQLLIIDALNLVRRMHATQPDSADMTALSLRITSAINKLINYHNPSHLVLVWDGDKESWRKQRYSEYKKGRKPMPDDLAAGLADLKKELASRHWYNLDAESEADDVIATLATKLVNSGGKAIIVSTDNGFSQLINPNIVQWDHFAQQFVDIAAMEQKLGVERTQFLEYWALAGSSGNKIPGITGIGPKSAAQLLQMFRSLSNIYLSLNELGEKQANKLAEGKDMARLSYKLAQLVTDMPLDVRLSEFRLANKAPKKE